MGGDDDWIRNLDLLRDIASYTEDDEFTARWRNVKIANKEKLRKWVFDHTKISIPINALYDVMVKRIHEYKR